MRIVERHLVGVAYGAITWCAFLQTSEREKRLTSALHGLGSYKDAVNSLSAWLEDTEELVSNQKPPSPDHKVVKAQLQEQKLLQKMIDDKETSVNGLSGLVDEVTPMAGDEAHRHHLRTVGEQLTDR